MRWAVPGLMDPGSPRERERLVRAWDGALVLDFYESPEHRPLENVDWWVSFQGQGQLVGRQRGALAVHTRIEDGSRIYSLNLGPRSLPPGTHRFEFIVGMGPVIVRYLTVPQTLANTVKPFRLNGYQEPCRKEQYFNRLVVWNESTNSFYVLGVDGDPA